MRVTRNKAKEGMTRLGGYTSAQQRYVQSLFPTDSRSWMQILVNNEITEEQFDKFKELGLSSKKKKLSERKSKLINAMSKADDSWDWKPSREDIPKAIKRKKKESKSAKKREKISKLDNKEFYSSRDWKEIRVRVLEKYDCSCMMCGRNYRDHKVVIHVDHIIPRSRQPELSLAFENLQILCEDCNIGKSNRYATDWRPD